MQGASFGCLWGSPGPSLMLEGEMLDIEAQRGSGLETKSVCPVRTFSKFYGSFCEAWR